jgi:glycosyltransferase involved in cell wall biosynthesis
VLEAAMMKVPTICFSDSGGIVEFVNDDCGWSISDFSINNASTRIIELEKNRKFVKEFGENAFSKVIKLHCTPDKIRTEYAHVVEETLK